MTWQYCPTALIAEKQLLTNDYISGVGGKVSNLEKLLAASLSFSVGRFQAVSKR
jgi:hypothetical protein